jgi:hypothetical protein
LPVLLATSMRHGRAMRVLGLVVLFGCRSDVRMTPATPHDVRALLDALDTSAQIKLQVGDDHASHGVASPGSWGTNLTVRELAENCRADRVVPPRPPRGSILAGPCLLADPHLHWRIGRQQTRVDGPRVVRDVLAIALPSALVYGNYECFGPGCGTPAKVAVGVGDGVAGLALVGLVAFVAVELAIAGHD